MASDGYVPDGERRELVALLGERGRRQYLFVRRVDQATIPIMGIVGVSGGWGIASNTAWLWIAAAALLGLSVVASVLAHIPIAGTLSPLLGRSKWWCGNHVILQPVRFIKWIDDQIAAKSGAHTLADDPQRDAAFAAALQMKSASDRLQRTSLKLQAASVLAVAIPTLGSLFHGPTAAPASTNLVTCGNLLGQSGLSGTDPSQLGALLMCSNPLESTVPATLAEGGQAFRCTSARGKSVTYAYFATANDAQTWAKSECRVEHLPLIDAYVQDSTAAVTSDSAVLHSLRAAGASKP